MPPCPSCLSIRYLPATNVPGSVEGRNAACVFWPGGEFDTRFVLLDCRLTNKQRSPEASFPKGSRASCGARRIHGISSSRSMEDPCASSREMCRPGAGWCRVRVGCEGPHDGLGATAFSRRPSLQGRREGRELLRQRGDVGGGRRAPWAAVGVCKRSRGNVGGRVVVWEGHTLRSPACLPPRIALAPRPTKW